MCGASKNYVFTNRSWKEPEEHVALMSLIDRQKSSVAFQVDSVHAIQGERHSGQILTFLNLAILDVGREIQRISDWSEN